MRLRPSAHSLLALLTCVGLACGSPNLFAQDADAPAADDAGADAVPEPPKGGPPKPSEIEKNLVTPELQAKVAKDTFDFKKYLRNGDMSERAKRVVSEGMQFKIYSMTDPEQRANQQALRLAIVRDTRQAAQLAGNPKQEEQFRTFLMNEVVKHLEDLFDNHITVRLNAVIVLGQLNQTEQQGLNKPPKPFLPAAVPLVKLLNDAKQPLVVKIAAAKAITRHLATDNLDPTVRLDAVRILVSEMLRTDADTHFYYQMRAANALADAQVLYDRGVARTPFVYDALLSIVKDQTRHPIVRCEAACSLGRIPLPPGVDGTALTKEIMKLANQMVQLQRGNPTMYFWTLAFTKLYLAFYPENADAKAKKAGLITKAGSELSGAAATITAAGPVIAKVTAHVLNQKGAPIPDNLAKPVTDMAA